MPETQRSAALPRRVGIIMDGNGRWAEQRGLPRTAGHKKGLSAAKRVVAEAARLGIEQVILYAFSTENWKRAEDEVGFLMDLVTAHLRSEFEFYREHGIRIAHAGDISGLPPRVAREIERAMADTAEFTGLTVCLAINYGGRDELVRAARRAASAGGGITEASLAAALDAPGDADLIIRTGGEKRLSNFLLWQAAYAELVFSPTLWPDYSAEEFASAVRDFSRRERRFGGAP